MTPTLAGCTFIRNGIQYDYNFAETIKSMIEFCDHVFVVDAGSSDGTFEEILKIHSDKLTLIRYSEDVWDAQKGTGQSKLCYFTDKAIEQAEQAGYDYVFSIQADETLHEDSYGEVRKAIATGKEAYMIHRINLWKTPYYQLDVPHERKPCSTHIVRLAKSCYRSYGDAESLAVPYADTYFINGIELWHYGFVRKKEVMKDKIINMQCGVFEMAEYDKKLDQCGVFNPDLWFDPETDLKLIDKPHPKIMQEWVKERL